jgi:hypothetical protein
MLLDRDEESERLRQYVDQLMSVVIEKAPQLLEELGKTGGQVRPRLNVGLLGPLGCGSPRACSYFHLFAAGQNACWPPTAVTPAVNPATLQHHGLLSPVLCRLNLLLRRLLYSY